MQRINSREVILSNQEQKFSDYFEMMLDHGYSTEKAVEKTKEQAQSEGYTFSPEFWAWLGK